MYRIIKAVALSADGLKLAVGAPSTDGEQIHYGIHPVVKILC
jgi:hypothetical protein